MQFFISIPRRKSLCLMLVVLAVVLQAHGLAAVVFIDPQAGNDANLGTKEKPIRTWAHFKKMMGPDVPAGGRIPIYADTRVEFLSNQQDNTDQLDFPFLLCARLTVVGTDETAQQAGTFTAVTPRVRAPFEQMTSWKVKDAALPANDAWSAQLDNLLVDTIFPGLLPYPIAMTPSLRRAIRMASRKYPMRSCRCSRKGCLLS